MVATAAALALGLTPAGAAGALAGALTGMLLFRRAEEEIGLGRVTLAALAAVLPLAVATLVAGGTAAGAALVGIVVASAWALAAAPAAVLSGRALHALLAWLAQGVDPQGPPP
jgi:hypothetical protein